MIAMTANDFILSMAVGLLCAGLLSIFAGIMVLLTKIAGKDMQTIAEQTVKMAQKGLAEDVAGLVGNASALIDAMNGLVKSVTGIGVFLVLVGFLLLAGAYGLILQLI